MEKFLKNTLLGAAFIGMLGTAKAETPKPGQQTKAPTAEEAVVAPESERESLLIADLQELEAKSEKTPEDQAQIQRIKDQLGTVDYPDPANPNNEMFASK